MSEPGAAVDSGDAHRLLALSPDDRTALRAVLARGTYGHCRLDHLLRHLARLGRRGLPAYDQLAVVVELAELDERLAVFAETMPGLEAFPRRFLFDMTTS
jgi:hypothetical protein